MSRRAAVAAVVVILWAGGMLALVRREMVRGEPERMARAGLLIAPGAEYYAVTLDSAPAGYASSTIDTVRTEIKLHEFLIVELPAGGGVRRLATRSFVTLTRALRLRTFRFDVGESFGPWSVSGLVEGDTMLRLIATGRSNHRDTTRVPLHGVLMLPTTVPLAIALEQRPSVGQQYSYSVYDPMTGAIADETVGVAAESLFVVSDSATLDTATHRWLAVHDDTVRAWRLEQVGKADGLLNGWVDEKGRVVRVVPLGRFALQRAAYEIAFQNWSLDSKVHPPRVLPRPGAATVAPLSGARVTPR